MLITLPKIQGAHFRLQQNFKIPPYVYQLNNSGFSTSIMKFHLESLKNELDGDIDSNGHHVMGDERWRPFLSNVHYSTSNCDPHVVSPCHLKTDLKSGNLVHIACGL